MSIISFGCLLVLILPSTKEGMFFTAGMGVVGVVWILIRKVKFSLKGNCVSSYLFAAPAVAVIATTFFSYRFYSYKLQVLGEITHIPYHVLLLILTVILAVGAMYFAVTFIEFMQQNIAGLSKKFVIIKEVTSCLAIAYIVFYLSQRMIYEATFSMGIVKGICGILIVVIAIQLLFGLLGDLRIATLIVSVLFMVIFTVNVYVFQFRGRLFEPIDVFTVGTVMNVMDSYTFFPFPITIVEGWNIWGLITIWTMGIVSKKEVRTGTKQRVVLTVSALAMIGLIWFYSSNLQTYHWQKEPATFNGYILDFVAKFKEIYVTKPEGYKEEIIAKLSDRYASTFSNSTKEKNPPHIIVIMNEAFSDLSVLGEINTDKEVAPFIASLKENTVSGYALTSVYGGNTANAEFEFLTGNSMAWLSANAVPYQQYVKKPTYSIVSYLKKFYDYKCIAMHPYLSTGWERPAVYENFGFDEKIFIEDFPQEEYVRHYISDSEMFQKMIEVYEKNKENPIFIFGVSMQNHGPYTYSGDNYEKEVDLTGYAKEYGAVEQYLTLINETDRAVEELITYFDKVNEDVVIVFFGDHQPKLSEEFYTEAAKSFPEILQEKQNRYKVPFFIWANYDIEEKQVKGTSLNYLTTYIYEAAGISLPPYNRFLQELEGKIPQMNANGFYSAEEQKYKTFEEVTQEEKEWLNIYEQLQYNNIFGGKRRDAHLFPIIEE